MLRALVERRIGRRDQASAWIWRLAEYTRDLHEEYAVQRWPETKRLLGLLVNSSGGAHARNARRLIHASRKQDRRLAAALLAAALAHTPEAEEALRGARTRMARKPPALARELLRNFPKRRARNNKRKRKSPKGAGGTAARARPGWLGSIPVDTEAESIAQAVSVAEGAGAGGWPWKSRSRRATRKRMASSAKEHRDVEHNGGRSQARTQPKARARPTKKPTKSPKEAVESAAARVKPRAPPRGRGKEKPSRAKPVAAKRAKAAKPKPRRARPPRGERPLLAASGTRSSIAQRSARTGAALIIDRISPRAAWPTPTLASSSSTDRMSISTVSWLRYGSSEVRSGSAFRRSRRRLRRSCPAGHRRRCREQRVVPRIRGQHSLPLGRGRAQSLLFLAHHLARVGAVSASKLEVLADGIV